MNVVDSSGWLEYFAGSEAADFFSEALEDSGNLIVPTISVYEVFKRLLQQRTESEALIAVAAMQQGTIVELSNDIALSAARFSHNTKIPMADSIIYVTADAHSADVWTQDEDLKDLERVHYQPKSES
jgi:predicted nucleic acid-binding protein